MTTADSREKAPENVSYLVYESAMVRAERTLKKVIIALIVAVALLFASNMIWLYVFSQYDFESYEYSQDGEGVNIIGDHNGVDYNGPESASAPQDQEIGVEG